jgi:5-formyltetrahydrofolate cyclo-ligase
MNVANAKMKLRKAARSQRERAAAACPDFAARIAAFADDLDLPPHAIVAGYAPFRGEADPHLLMAELEKRGAILALPRVAAKDAPLVFHRWDISVPLLQSALGILEPHANGPVVVPDMLLVPLLAFDARGHRLGYGGGFYDRTLAALRASSSGVRAIGIAYAGQEIPQIARGAHDQRLDALITETGVRQFGSR